LLIRHKALLFGSTTWSNGKREGVQYSYYKKRASPSSAAELQLKSTITWKDNMKCGVSERWNIQGLKISSTQYVANKQHGLSQRMFDSGNLKYSSNYENDVKNGEEFELNTAGNKILSSFYKNGLKQVESRFSNTGLEKYSCSFTNGRRRKEIISFDGKQKKTFFVFGIPLLSLVVQQPVSV